MNTELRKDCPMRHKNGNCMPAGGFCTAVNDPICEALHNAYDTGRCAADVVEVKHGKWIEKENNYDTYYDCSVCGDSFVFIEGGPIDNLYYYCPNCGAKMDGDRNA